jgi:predicted RNase H-like nuclease
LRVLGLDGFRNGWVMVSLDGRGADIAFPATIAAALAKPFNRAAIDIPIGMTDNGERLCDRLARERLHPHRSRVFTGARRWLWELFDDPDRANAEAQRRGQKRVSRQLWHLGPKITQVDAFVRAHPAMDIREVHPELAFLRLTDGKPLPSKKSAQGVALRRSLLKQKGFNDVDRWLTEARIGTGARLDDVLDACAVAIAARDSAGCLPEGLPPRDAHDLPMQIWF